MHLSVYEGSIYAISDLANFSSILCYAMKKVMNNVDMMLSGSKSCEVVWHLAFLFFLELLVMWRNYNMTPDFSLA